MAAIQKLILMKKLKTNKKLRKKSQANRQALKIYILKKKRIRKELINRIYKSKIIITNYNY